jgi:hypothetical protein
MNVKTRKAARRLALALALSSCATAAFAGNVKKPYMIYEGDPTTMTVLWQDNATETTNTITWGTDSTFTTNLGSVTVPEYTPSPLAPTLYTHQHKYKITGLNPATKYYYQVADATNGVYGTGSFVTAPAASATSVKFLAFGDTRSQPNVMEQVIQEMRKVYAADPAFQSITIQAGDWVHTDGPGIAPSDGEDAWGNSTSNTVPGGAYYEWFNTNPQTQAFLAETPINGVKGNHENNGGYSQLFPKYYPYPYPYINTVATTNAYPDPKSNNLYWSFDYGPVHFTLVDQYSEYCYAGQPNTTCATSLTNSPQYDWVANDLKTTTKPWKVLMYHEPTWGAGTHTNNYKSQLAFDRLTQQYGVDMVYSGHNHNYARAQVNTLVETKPIAGATPQNTVVLGVQDTIVPNVPYLTVGNGGAGFYTVDLTNASTGCTGAPTGDYLPNNCFRHIVAAVANYGYATFNVNDKTLTMSAYQVFHGDGVTPAKGTDTLPQTTSSSLIETVTLTHPTDITTLFGVATSGLTYSRATQTYSGTVTVTNNSAAPTSLKLSLYLNNLSAGVTLLNATGTDNGVPYIDQTVNLAPGAYIMYPVKFSNPSNQFIHYEPALKRNR